MNAQRPLTHADYADEAEAAVRGGAWPQAAALLRKAIEACPDAGTTEAYQTLAARCDQEIEVEKELAAIAKRVLRIPALESRNSDRLDFHEVSAWSVKEALRLAYQAGRDALRS